MYKRQALDPTTIDPAVGPDDAIDTNVEESGSVFMPAVDLSLIHISEPTRPY